MVIKTVYVLLVCVYIYVRVEIAQMQELTEHMVITSNYRSSAQNINTHTHTSSSFYDQLLFSFLKPSLGENDQFLLSSSSSTIERDLKPYIASFLLHKSMHTFFSLLKPSLSEIDQFWLNSSSSTNERDLKPYTASFKSMCIVGWMCMFMRSICMYVTRNNYSFYLCSVNSFSMNVKMC